MARWLYTVGSWAARRAWVVVTIWAILLGGLGIGAATLAHPYTSKITIPGTEFQTVIDDLQSALPKAAGGSATVVFNTTDGKPFTQAQKDAVATVVASWKRTDGVSSATNPFTTQKKLDDATTKVRDAKKKLADGREKIKKNTKKLAGATKDIADGRTTVAKNVQKLDDGVVKLDAAQKKVDKGRASLKKGAAKLAKGKKALAHGQKLLTAGREKLDAGLAAQGMSEAAVPVALAKLNAGIDQLTGAIAQLTAGGGDANTIAGLKAQLATYQGQAAQLKTAEAAITTIKTNQAKLDAGEKSLKAGEKKLAAGRTALAKGQAAIDTNRAKIADGRRQLATASDKLDDAATKVADGKKKLAKGEKKLDDGELDLVRGVREIALTKGLRMVSTKGDVAISQLGFTQPSESVTAATKAAVPAAATALAAAGVNAEYSKEVASTLPGVSIKEGAGVIVAAVVLFVMLGSLLAAGLPLLTALVGVGAGMLGVEIVTHWVEMSNVTPILALMLGLAVGIDYALFLVNRHRHQLVEGMEAIESIGRATGTAGSAVLVAGLTVITALTALTLTGIPFLSVMGLSAAGTVAAAVLVSITLTPAILRFIGPRILSRKGRAKLAARLEAGRTAASTPLHAAAKAAAGRGKGWGGLVTRHPVLALVASVVVLGIIALPAASLKLGLPDGSSEPEDSTAYRAYTMVADNFGPGLNGAVIAVAKLPAATAASLSSDALTDLKLDVADQLKTIPGIKYVVPAMTSKDHRTLVFQIVPTTGPSDDATSALVTALRAQRTTVMTGNGLTSLGFAGQTVANIDISERLAAALPGYLVVVVGISLILLLLVFRSLLVPVLATGGFLLSVAASFGGVVAVYQWGWLGPLFGVEHPGLVLSFLPTLCIGILFGLAMDYQMFLVSGMREAWAHGQDARTAVRTGFSHGAKVITAAGLIMVSVFSSFIFSDTTMARPIGFALAIGVLIDAFVVRMTIIPALMHLFGEAAWYIPTWLDRFLPDLDVEGAKLSEWLHEQRSGSHSDDKSLGKALPEPA